MNRLLLIIMIKPSFKEKKITIIIKTKTDTHNLITSVTDTPCCSKDKIPAPLDIE